MAEIEMEMEMEEVWNRKSIKRRRALKEGWVVFHPVEEAMTPRINCLHFFFHRHHELISLRLN